MLTLSESVSQVQRRQLEGPWVIKVRLAGSFDGVFETRSHTQIAGYRRGYSERLKYRNNI